MVIWKPAAHACGYLMGMNFLQGVVFSGLMPCFLTMEYPFFLPKIFFLSRQLAMETPILLEATCRQMAFLGEITDRRLQEVLFSRHPLILHNLKRILGKEFLMAYHKYKANANIPAFFLQ